MAKKTKEAAINWAISGDDEEIISKITDRAMALAAKAKIVYPRLDCEMDLIACHLNAQPLRLADLLKADDFNFAHDVFGIKRHIDRETAQLRDFFSPRFSSRQDAKR